MEVHAACSPERETELLRLLDGERRRGDKFRAQVTMLQHRLTKVQAERDELKSKLQATIVTLTELQKQLFGRKSERATDVAEETPATASPAAAYRVASPEKAPGERKRGQQQGAPGHGRRLHPHLPTEVLEQEIPSGEQCCPQCGMPYEDMGSAEESEEIEWLVRLVRRVHRRHRYARTCRCAGVPAIITAPPPARVIPKGMFSVGFIALLLVEKFILGRPLHRIILLLAMQGLEVSPGTLVGVLGRVLPLLRPLYMEISAYNATEHHLHADETGWRVFESETGHRWWVWVFVGELTVFFAIRPTRSGDVVEEHLGLEAKDADGSGLTLLSDFFPGYNRLAKKGVQLAGCWVHARRPILRVAQALPTLATWGEAWRQRIATLYRLHKVWRAEKKDTPAYEVARTRVQEHVEAIRQTLLIEVTDRELQLQARKALSLMAKGWPRLTRFLADPAVALDNNTAERSLRTPVIGRKNFYGSGAAWSAELAAVVWTIAATANLHGIEPLHFLQEYLGVCAEQGGKPPQGEALARFRFWLKPAVPQGEDTS
ncbi:MAG: IS66 family transposase [Candidatus Dormibacteria bacterium]